MEKLKRQYAELCNDIGYYITRNTNDCCFRDLQDAMIKEKEYRNVLEDLGVDAYKIFKESYEDGVKSGESLNKKEEILENDCLYALVFVDYDDNKTIEGVFLDENVAEGYGNKNSGGYKEYYVKELVYHKGFYKNKG